MGALDWTKRKLIVTASRTKRSTDFIALLESLDRLYSPKPGLRIKPVVIVLDSGPIHVSKATMAALAARAHWLIVEWLPKYAPHSFVSLVEEGAPRTGKAAHDSADGNLQDIRRFLVGEAVDADENDEHLLVLRQLRDAFRDLAQCQVAFSNVASVIARHFVGLIDIDRFAPHLASAPLIEPCVLSDPKHPAVEPRPRFLLFKARQSSCAGFLHKVVAFVPVFRQSMGEAAQARQKVYILEAEVIAHDTVPPDARITGS